MSDITIIGAGIGGLTTAIALQQKGFTVRLFEQAEILKPVGAGIILANNAMQVYEKLGLKRTIEENGNYIGTVKITEPNLKPISSVDLTYFEEKYGVRNIAIHRGELQRILVDHLKDVPINLNHQLKKVIPNENGYLLEFKNGKSLQTAIVIGADGINSTVRQLIFPENKIRMANQICWRGISEYNLSQPHSNELNEAWGKNSRFGFVQIKKDKVYWYALKTGKEMTPFSIGNFKTYHPIIQDILGNTEQKHINTALITDLKLTSNWHQNNLCLIGDAAHATTPNLGQGACQAIEDAYILGECLAKYDTTIAFETFQMHRIPKTHLVVKKSWTLGKMAHLSNPILIWLRNFILQLIPSSINRKQSEKIFQIPSI